MVTRPDRGGWEKRGVSAPGGTGGVSDTHLFGIGSDVPFDYSVRRRVTFDYSVSVGCCSTTPCGAG